MCTGLFTPLLNRLSQVHKNRSTTKPHCNSKKSSHSLITVQKISYIIISVLKRRRRFPALPYSLVIVISFKSLRNCADKFLCSFWVMVVYDLVDCHLFSFLARFLRDESLSCPFSYSRYRIGCRFDSVGGQRPVSLHSPDREGVAQSLIGHIITAGHFPAISVQIH